MNIKAKANDINDILQIFR